MVSHYRLEGSTALVTGATGGLGRAIVSALLQEGVRVVASSRNGAALAEMAAELDSRMLLVHAADLTDPDDVDGLVPSVIAETGRLDIVVNNAGASMRGALVDQNRADWERAFALNVLAPMAICKGAAEPFRRQGRGKVVNIASTAGVRGKAGVVAYSASKAALIQFTSAWALEMAAHGVQVNAIAPGAFATPMQEEQLGTEDARAVRVARIPAGRMGDPVEIGAVVCFLSSHLCDFMTGSLITMDGGEVVGL